ncbi:glycosyltransferase [Alteromonas sp. MmMcT2-5]|uniref:glycosyltransferase n=1 Tax=Alteromonas sp. MmMcT2-5 TaxID=2917733 RepID=UPI001448593E|nr:glycosyltransferase [Alteromonas sp. MmMcT2-5]MCG7650820.1 glycosyltransferase [Alteromonas sp. MmMcT2-5]NKX32380.1 hypothetical protein [Alteromonadaceae bacterium A_SAG1]
MSEKIYQAYNAKEYSLCLDLILELEDSPSYDLLVVKANSLRACNDVEAAVDEYHNLLCLNKKDHRVAYHGLSILQVVENNVDKAKVFLEALTFKNSLQVVESELVVRWCQFKELRGYLKFAIKKCVSSCALFLNVHSKGIIPDFEIFENEFTSVFGKISLNNRNYKSLSTQDRKIFFYLINYQIDKTGEKLNWKSLFEKDQFNELLDDDCLFSILSGKTALEQFDGLIELFREKGLSFERIYAYIMYGRRHRYVDNQTFKNILSLIKSELSKQHFVSLTLERKLGNILIVAPAFLGKNSSYVTFIRDYMIALKSVMPKIKFCIMVTDEIFFNVFHLNGGPKHNSRFFEKAHLEMLSEAGLDDCVEIEYLRPYETAEFIQKIEVFCPDVSLYFSAYGSYLYSDLLHEKLPSIYLQTNKNDNPTYACDLYLSFMNEVVEERLRDPFFEQKIALQHSPYILMSPDEKVTPKEYLGADYDFVMVTVGARLDLELTEDFLESVLKLIAVENKKLCWLIIGNANERRVIARATELGVVDQIVFKKYEKNLKLAYSVSHLYINPPRTGGGISIAYAVFCNVPAVVFSGADATPFIADASFDDLSSYIYEISKLMCDEKALIELHRKQLGALSKTHSRVAVGRSMVDNICRAFYNFERRSLHGLFER